MLIAADTVAVEDGRLPLRPRLRTSVRLGLAMLGLMLVAAVLGPMLSPYAYDAQSLALMGLPHAPSRAHWLGTDELGRDELTRLLYGGRISLSVGLAGAACATMFGTTIGALAGYAGGLTDRMAMRLTDVMLSIPALPLVLVVSGLVRPTPALLVLLIAGLIWTPTARLVRAQVSGLKAWDFVAAARALGVGPVAIVVRHILPNALGAIAVSATIAVGGAIMLESALSFLGFGIQPPTPSWGSLLNKSEPWLVSAPWLSIPPGVAIFLTILSVNLLGDGLRRGVGR
ncbi:ABC transporter permease [Sphingomonas nostoxanthinifaciens]|uniref:ABC transporter permease n=1 Tax=Sphingomonas nostoxanthinifaciens TaxID=2872652 RepID=UPI001CC20FB9|nr:ABC transporter permease [Sphingomonas nostoxanthinifaciens]UAK23783.1 ABC transporter permease [Sphingomonas nostoxanthinifaciens]